MKRLIAIGLSLFLCNPAGATWTLVQHKFKSAPGSGACPVTVTSTGSGNALLAIAGWNASGQSLNAIPTNGCAGTWTHCTTCTASDAGTGVAMDIYYCLNSASGATTITINGTGTIHECEVIEYSTTAGPPLFDIGGNRDQSASVTSCPGVTLSPTGSNDVIFQGNDTVSTTAIAGGTYVVLDLPNNRGYAHQLNSSDGTAPTWTQTASGSALSAIALKETSGAATTGFNKSKRIQLMED